ncbi:MAG: hypothetical protein IJA15_03755 [Clostridia bacterium]|nr:hypothetical protein [Clostridia bacterium]
MKLLKKITVFVLLLVICLQTVACGGVTGNKDGYRKPEIDGPHMSERLYERVDEEAAMAAISEVCALTKQENKLEELTQKREDFFTNFYNQLDTMTTLASINYDLDNTSEYWKEESLESTNIYSRLQNETIKMEQAVLGSELYGQTFIDELGQGYADMILSNQTDTEEQLAILEEINQIKNDYITKMQVGDTESLYTDYVNFVNLSNEYARSKTDDEGNPYTNYLDFAYETQFMRDYTPEEAHEFQLEIKTKIKDAKEIIDIYSERVTASSTIISTDMLKEFIPAVIEKTAPSMMDSWNYMMERDLYDFSISSKKSDTSYVTTFQAYDDAYLFLNASSLFVQDVSTLIHEFGHYNENFMACPDWADPNLPSSNYDLLETHSQAFELITLPAVGEVIKEKYPNDKNLYKSYTFNLIDSLIWVLQSGTCFSNFEYEIYTASEEELTEDFIKNTFNKLSYQYIPGTGISFYHVNHFFSAPAYYISYPVSMVFSAEIWATNKAVENYINVVKLGGQNTLSTVCEKTKLPSPLSSEAIDMVCDKIVEFAEKVYYQK